MNTLNLHHILFGTFLVLAALLMLPACSSTEESSETSSGGGSYDQCIAGCAEGDVDCRELCLRQYTP